MDDFSIDDARLTDTLDEIHRVNRWLGGHRTMRRVLAPYLRRAAGPVRLLDLGTGLADFPAMLLQWAEKENIDLHITALDANPATIKHAAHFLDSALSPDQRQRIELVVGDALEIPFAENSFDLVTAALFLHHLEDADAVRLLRAMDRVARDGLLINDLHRHPLAYYGIQLHAKLLPVTPMFAYDAPLSVLRAFTREELQRLAHEAGLDDAQLAWHWAFRWTLSTVKRAA